MKNQINKFIVSIGICLFQISISAQVCGTCSNPNCTITDNTTATDGNITTYNDCYTLPTPATSGNIDNCYTITTNSTGKLGFRLSEQIRQNQSMPGQCGNSELDAIDATRTFTLKLASDGCGGTAIPADGTNVNNSATGFNPEWYNLLPNTDYTLCTSVTIAPGGNCQFEQVCMVGYHLTSTTPPPNGCNADIGDYDITDATQVGAYEYDLDDGCSINLDLNNLVIPSGGEVRWAVFSQAPTLPLSSAQLNDLTSVAGFLGTDGNQATSVANSGGQSVTPAGFTTLWAVPFTTDNTGTSTQIDDGDDCYDIQSNAIQINFTSTPCTPPVNTCGDCSTPNCPIGNVPTYNDRFLPSHPTNPGQGAQTCASGLSISGTYKTYQTVTSDVLGTLGAYVQNIIQTTGSSTTITHELFAVSDCDGTNITATNNNVAGRSQATGAWNPEWYSLTPNTTYILVTTFTVTGVMTNYCMDYYHIPNPPDPCAMQNGSVQTCNCEFTDSGGNSSSYGAGENSTFVICPDPAQSGAKIQLDFTSFDVEDGFELMKIYDGNTATGQPIISVSGSNPTELNSTIAATISNTSGCLTVVFTSDNGIQNDGWTADVTCYTPCTLPVADASTTEFGTQQTIRICPGDQLNFDGSTSTHNATSITDYAWDFDNGTTGSSATEAVTFNDPGRYIPYLTVTNDEGCSSTNALPYEVIVSTVPNFNTTTADQTACEGDQVCLTGVINYPTLVDAPEVPPTGTVTLPDGTGVAYETTVLIKGYTIGQTITSASDLQSICVNMEHSALDDITITLIAPSGEEITLHDRGGGASALGVPTLDANAYSGTLGCDFGGGASGPGTGWDYCFNSSASETFMDHGDANWDNSTNPCYQVPAGDYLPIDPFSGLIGADLNGTWTIRYEDASGNDDGYLFGWDLTFDPSLLPANATISPVIATQAWTGPTTIDSNVDDVICITPDNTGTNTYTYTVTNDFGCIADTTIDVDVTVAPVLPGVTNVNYCINETATSLTATTTGANTLLWYTNATGGTGSSTAPTPTTTSAGTTSYYVSQTDGTCEGPRAQIDVIVGTLADPTVSNINYCLNETATPLTATTTGTNTLLWYTTATGGTGNSIAPTPTTTTAGTTSYYVSETNGTCESSRVQIDVVVGSLAAPTATNVNYCLNASATPLTATTTGANTLLWYTNSAGGTGSSTAPNPSTTSAGTTSYYVSQTNGTCESTRTKIDVVVGSLVAPSVTNVNYCLNASSTPLTASTTGTNTLLWYTTATGGTGTSTTPTPTTSTAGTTSFYVSQTNGTCESSRAKIDVIVGSLTEPIVTNVDYCLNETSVALTANTTGANTLLWYTTATGGTGTSTAPTPTTTTAGTTSYFVAQTNGTCESSRVQIDVVVGSLAAPTVTDEDYCLNEASVNLTATTTGSNTLLWYTTATGGSGSTTAPTPTTSTAGTTSYYVSQTNGSCESPRAQIDVDVVSTPTPSTINIPYCQNDVSSALTATTTGTNTLLWYTTASGGIGTSTSPTPATSTAGITSYYVSQTNGTCESPRAQIDVTVNAMDDASFILTPNCDGAIANITGTAGGTFTFSTPPSDAAVIDANTGTVTGGTPNTSYSITYTTQGVCPDNSIQNLFVLSNESPIITCGIASEDSVDFNWTIPNGATDYDLSYSIMGQSPVSITNHPTNRFGVTGLNVGDTVSITVSPNGAGCYTTSSNICFTSCTPPNASFLPSPSKMTTLNTTTTMINSSSNATSYLWDFGDGNTSMLESPTNQYSDLDTGTYLITLTASNGSCQDIATYYVKVFEDLVYYIPNTFTPYDGNDYNQLFKPVFTSGYDTGNYSMEIFNRWGELIFSTSDIDEGWDGKDMRTGKICEDGTYIWKIIFGIKSIDKNETINGHVNLLR